MKYFKNTELARIYKVSEKSVRNWIQASIDGKLGLKLYEENGRKYVANTSNNSALIEELVEKGKKYKNTRGLQIIRPIDKFYETFDSKQIFDIISSLTIHKELPLKYSYLDGGADYWDRYAQRLANEKSANLVSATIQLIDANLERLGEMIQSQNRKINIIDLGAGNAIPSKGIIDYFFQKKLLNRYIAVDISRDMIEVAKNNIGKWYDEKVLFEGHVRDLEYEQFDDLFAQEYAGDDADIPINLVIMLGGTLCNFRNPDRALMAINNSLGIDDWFVYSMKLDTPNSRRHFDFSVTSEHQELSSRHRLIVDLLGIDRMLYEPDYKFSEVEGSRSISIVPKVDMSIRFELENGTRIVEIHKGEPVLLWRYLQWDAVSVINRFDRNGFDLMHASSAADKEYLVLASKIKTKK